MTKMKSSVARIKKTAPEDTAKLPKGYVIQDGCYNCKHSRNGSYNVLCCKDGVPPPDGVIDQEDRKEADAYWDALDEWETGREVVDSGKCRAWELDVDEDEV